MKPVSILFDSAIDTLALLLMHDYCCGFSFYQLVVTQKSLLKQENAIGIIFWMACARENNPLENVQKF